MAAIAEYLLSVTAAGILCAIVRNILKDNHSSGKIIQTVSGVFMVITIFAPIINFEMDDFEDYFQNFRYSSEEVSGEGVEMALDAMTEIIKQQTESYILEKAKSMGIDIDVDVTISDAYPPVPKEVILSGNVSPYKKNIITDYICSNFEISEENQKWT